MGIEPTSEVWDEPAGIGFRQHLAEQFKSIREDQAMSHSGSWRPAIRTVIRSRARSDKMSAFPEVLVECLDSN
jgi:hypothetical protein